MCREQPALPEDFKIEAVKKVIARGLSVAKGVARSGVSTHRLSALQCAYQGCEHVQ